MRDPGVQRKQILGRVQARAGKPRIVVIGAGIAGICAAVAAAASNAVEVLLLDDMDAIENEPRLGRRAVFNAVDPERQAMLGISDTPELFVRQMLASGEFRASPKLVRRFCYQGYGALKWLEELGLVLEPGVDFIAGGLYPRTHRAADPWRFRLTMCELAQERGVILLPSLLVEALELTRAGAVAGLRCVDPFGVALRIPAEAVVLATGGFAANRSLCGRIHPQTADLLCTALDSSRGLGHKLAAGIGASFVGMDYMHFDCGIPDRKTVLPFRMQPMNYLLFSDEGKRIVNEASLEKTTEAILSSPRKRLWMVMPAAEGGRLEPRERGMLRHLCSIGVVRRLYLDREESDFPFASRDVRSAVASLDAGSADPFGRPRGAFPPGPYLCAPYTIARARTLGGVRINEHAEVFDDSEKLIPGLYAAGDVAGGLHGCRYVEGNGFAAAAVFGRTAGSRAVARLFDITRQRPGRDV